MCERERVCVFVLRCRDRAAAVSRGRRSSASRIEELTYIAANVAAPDTTAFVRNETGVNVTVGVLHLNDDVLLSLTDEDFSVGLESPVPEVFIDCVTLRIDMVFTRSEVDVLS